ncbi:MAG: hypothetical protein ACKOXM_06005, partial [Agromyces sp.]
MSALPWKVGLRHEGNLADYALRVSLICVALATLVFGALAYPDLVTDTPADLLPLNQLQFAFVIGVPVLLGFLTLVAPARVLRVGSAMYSIAYLILLLAWAIAGPERIDPHGNVWIISITA